MVPVATAWWMRNDGSGMRVTEKTMGHCKQRRCLPTHRQRRRGDDDDDGGGGGGDTNPVISFT